MENTSVVIYKIVCPITGVVKYIGKTINFRRRIYQHTCRNKKGKNIRLFNWINKLKRTHGLNPIFEIVEVCSSENWEVREMHWISHFNSIIPLLNFTLGGEGKHGVKMSEAHKAIISRAHKGKRKNYKCVGGVKSHSEMSKKKISISKLGQSKKGKEIVLIKKDGSKIDFSSLTDASRRTHIKITSISNNLKGYSKITKIGTWIYKTI